MDQNQTRDSINELNKRQPPVQTFRSMRSDVVDAAHSENKSLAQLVISSQEKKRKKLLRQDKVIRLEEGQHRIIAIIILVVLLAATIGLLGLKIHTMITKSHESIKFEAPVIVLPNSQEALSITDTNKDLFAQKIEDVLAPGSMTFGNIKHIYFTSSPSGITKKTLSKGDPDIAHLNSVLSLSTDTLPALLKRSFSQESYMYGVHARTQNSVEPFILIKVISYDGAYAGMLEWEKNIISDLSSLFKLRYSGVATKFNDSIVSNKDTRLLLTRQSDEALVYSFLERDLLLITTNKNTFNEVVNRYIQAGEILEQ